MRSTLRVETPLATISDTAPITARSLRLQRPIRPSGNQLPILTLGILMPMGPTPVMGARSLQPFREFPCSSRIASAWVLMISSAGDSAMVPTSSLISTIPSSNPGIPGRARGISVKVLVAVATLF